MQSSKENDTQSSEFQPRCDMFLHPGKLYRVCPLSVTALAASAPHPGYSLCLDTLTTASKDTTH